MAGENWPLVPLGELTENLDGRRVPVRENDRKPGPYPYYGASGVVDRVDGYLFDGDYLLIGEDGENLRTRQTPIAFMATGKFWVNNHAHIVRGNRRADTRFLSYVLSQTDISGFLTGSTMPKLTKGNLNRLPVIAPPLAEQKAIAGVLGALDDKIELNRRMNATLEALARALFQSWFVDFDPVRAKLDGRPPAALDPATAALFPDHFQDSEAGPIPFGWEVSKLKDLTSKIGSGATPRGGSEVYVDAGPALIRKQNVYDHEFHWAGLARLTDKSASELKNVEVIQDDVLLNITGDSILRTCVVDPAVLPARVNQHVAIIRAIEGIPPRYLHLHLVQDSIKSFLIGMSAGATRHAITKGHLESTDVLKPSAPVLSAFEKITTPWFDQIDANRTQSRTLATLRDTLLPKLLSGELSVDHVMAAAEEVL